ncbi:nitrous oxide reductase family maturation protein NosD [Halobacteriaceae archaeon GCM10025711]
MHQRSVTLGVVVLVVAAMGGGVGLAPAAASQPTAVDGCTTIDAPGSYVLSGDVTDANATEWAPALRENLDPAEPACIVIRSSDVTFDGGGHAIDGRGQSGIAIAVTEDIVTPVRNVTVRNVRITDWNQTLLGLGSPDLTVTGVVAANNSRGIGTAFDVARQTFVDNTLRRSGGIATFESADSRVAGNVITDGRGIFLGETGHSVVTGNRVRSANRTGITLDAVWNTRVTDNVVAGNGAGIEHAFYGDNRIEGNEIRGNDGFGVFLGEFTSGTRVVGNRIVGNGGDGIRVAGASDSRFVRNVVRDSGGWAFVSVPSPFSGGTNNSVVDLDVGPTVSFTGRHVAVGPAESPPSPPDGLRAAGSFVATERTDANASLELTLPYDATAVGRDGTPSLWRYDGRWRRVADARIDRTAGTITTNLTAFGVLAPLVSDRNDRLGDTNRTTAPATTEPVTTTPTTPEPSASTLEVLSTTPGERLVYEFVVAGTVTRTQTSEDVAAGDNDAVIERGDGTVKVRGVTGNRLGDAYVVQGSVVSFERVGGDSDFRLRLDGRPVSVADLTADAGTRTGAPVTAQPAIPVQGDTLEVVSTTPGERLVYEFAVEGRVARTQTSADVAAGDNDVIIEQGDGTVTVRGVTGNQRGDAYVVDGRVVSFEQVGGDSGYELRLNGRVVDRETLVSGDG